MRPAWADVDLDAIAHNVSVLTAVCAPARLCAVVKADGYGHGAIPVARAAVDAGASMLGVALVDEGIELREAGLDGPILLLSEAPAEEFDAVALHGLRPTLYTAIGIEAAAAAVRRCGRSEPLPVHLKVDTGMHRVGARPDEALALADKVAGLPELQLEGVFTHCAVADEPDDPYTSEQLARFEAVLAELAAAGINPDLRHAANSALGFTRADGRYDLVRAGISVYGLAPAPALAGWEGVDRLRPALSLRARVSHVKRLDAGERVSYGLRYRLERPGTVATVPLGYADGVRRRLPATGAEVLIGGERRPMAGTVTMDQLMVDCGDAPVAPGDEVVLLGRQGDQEITADEWALRLDTISYEITCGIGPRVPRRYSPTRRD